MSNGEERTMHTETTPYEPLRSGRLFGACCFNCESWAGSKRKQAAYCYELLLSGCDAPDGDCWCSLWKRRKNSRLPNTKTCHGPEAKP